MRSSRSNRVALILGVLIVSPHVGAAPASTDYCETRYEPIDIDAPGFGKTYALALNNRGHITGNSSSSAFLWSCDKGLEDIGQSLGRPDNIGIALNDHDHVVVVAAPEISSYLPDTFLWQRGKPVVVMAREAEFTPEILSNTGIATMYQLQWSRRTGLTEIDVGVPVLYGHATNLGRFGGIAFDEATWEHRVFTWTRREGVTLLGPAIAESEYSVDINDRGDLLVSADSSTSRTGYIVDRKGNIEVLPPQPDARITYVARLNLQREVIGSEVTFEQQPHGDFSRAFVWDAKHGYRDLNQLFDSTPGNGFSPTSINDWGWILGNRRDFNASLLVPVPTNVRRFENLNRLRGAKLCRALAEVKVHRLLCSLRQ